jgi:hypothetical protein
MRSLDRLALASLVSLAIAFPAAAQAPAAAPTDALADSVLRACRGTFGVHGQCVERALDEVLRRSGIATAMAVLDRMVEKDGGLTPEAHSIAHGLGIAAYQSPETVAATFAQCPNTQIAGCYHGVIQGYFLDVAARTGQVAAADLDALCQPHRATPALFFECTHGMGHGLMALYGHRLPDALASCDLVSDPAARDSCWGGAFMENIVGALHPGTTAEAHAATAHGAMGHAGMDHGGMDHGTMDHAAMGHTGMQQGAPARPWRALDRGDLLYPCTAVEAKYHRACYTIQTAAILGMNGGRFGHAAHVCNRAPDPMVAVCRASLGRDLTAYTHRDPERTAHHCQRLGAAAADCLRGAAYALIDVASRPANALPLCRAATGDTRKRACYAALGARARIATPDPAALAAVCAQVEAAYVGDCRAAAGLADERAGAP